MSIVPKTKKIYIWFRFFHLSHMDTFLAWFQDTPVTCHVLFFKKSKCTRYFFHLSAWTLFLDWLQNKLVFFVFFYYVKKLTCRSYNWT